MTRSNCSPGDSGRARAMKFGCIVASPSAAGRSSGVRRILSERLLRLSLGLVPKERHRLFALTILLGGACGVIAVAFHSAIRGAERLLIEPAFELRGASGVLWILLTPTGGALLSGLLLHYVFPNARGSGVPQVKVAYAGASGRVRLRDAIGKFCVATLQIGTGSALGREGPTVQICAGAASALARLFAISPGNRRRLLPVGAAAGVAAAFNAPIAAVTFISEEIIGDLDQTLLSGVVVAAALAAVIERSLLGDEPVFHVPKGYALEHASSLLVYAALGAASGLLAQAFYRALLGLRAYCRRHGARFAWAWPALGGLVTGALALAVLKWLGMSGVTGDGYSTLSAALEGRLAISALLSLMVAKFIATVFCYSTGGAGGLFAPVLFMGGMLGGSFGLLDQLVLRHGDAQLGAFALVGMGALFAAVIRAPITSVLIIFEMTGSYALVLPLMIANSAGYVIARRLYATPIYDALLEQDGVPPLRQAVASSGLAAFRVSDAMTTELVTLSAGETLEAALAHIADLPYSIYPVLNERRELLGLVSEARVRRRIAGGLAGAKLGELARAREYLRADAALSDAVARMNKLGARQMAVVGAQPTQLLGMLAMSDVMRAHAHAAGRADPGPVARSADGRRPAVAWRRHDSTSGFSPVEPPDSERPPSSEK